MRKKLLATATLMMAGCILLLADSRGPKVVRARLVGFQEVPAISSAARGDFKAQMDRSDTQLTYELEYSVLSASVTQAHIHFGARGTNGGIMIWLCGTPALPGPAGTPSCPASGKVTRTVTAADVIGPAGQGIAAGEFAEALAAVARGSCLR